MADNHTRSSRPQVLSTMPRAVLAAVAAITAEAFALKDAPLLAIMSGVGAPPGRLWGRACKDLTFQPA